MDKRTYESPVLEIVQFVAQENLAAELGDNDGAFLSGWNKSVE